MDNVILNSDDERFLRQANKFCHSITRYQYLFQLDTNKLADFQSNLDLLMYVAENPSSFTPDFIKFNLAGIKAQFKAFKTACLQCRDYKLAIGVELGFETSPQNKPELTWSWNEWFTSTWKPGPNFS